MILLYRVLTNLLYPFLFIFIYLRKIFKKEDPYRYKEKILPKHFKVKRNQFLKLVWFHAASIGEFKSIIPVIEKLVVSNKNLEILITTTTLSSGNLAQTELKKFNKVYHRYFPFDNLLIVEKFLNNWKPNFIFFVDSEIWPNLILTARKNKIPMALINARLTEKTFNRWMIFPFTAKKIFSSFNLCLTSNSQTKNYLKQLDANNISFFGNLKLTNEINEQKIKNLNEKFLINKRFWIAASTHQGEDLFCLKVHKKIKERYKDIITIIAPRHINKAKEISNLANSLGLKTQLLYKDEIISDNKEIVIINSFGALQDYFKYAKSVFIGKSILKNLKDEGGQNPIDAAKLKCKIYHGPYVYNFEDIYEILRKNGVAKKIEKYEELSEDLIKDLSNPQKKEDININYIKNLGQKTLEDTMVSINNFIK